MPRISPCTIRKAYRIHPFLRFLLPACRTISEAERELKWIQDESAEACVHTSQRNLKRKIQNACIQRSRLIPLQYILGSQPFGPLHIICKPGVLIPRWETEEWSCDLASRIKAHIPTTVSDFNVWDICTGTGCIALLLRRELEDYKNLKVTAVDCSKNAIQLVGENVKCNKMAQIQIKQMNILNQSGRSIPKIDILISNPPYIPKELFMKETNISVKLYEPKIALIGDKEFYQNLVSIWLPRIDSFVYEVGDITQCHFVKDKVKDDVALRKIWSVGYRFDSNGKPRVVYGFRNGGTRLKNLPLVFKNFGQIMHSPK